MSMCMAPSSIMLTNGVVVFGLDQTTKLTALTQRLFDFISPYFLPISSGEPHFRIALEDIAVFPDQWRACADQPITIRKSSSPIFHLTGRSFMPDNHTLIVLDDTTGTGYHIQYATNVITFFGSDASFIHLIELVRYVSLLIEEAHGTLVLHATASIHDDACYLIVGEKGAGKSTTLLHLTLDHGHAYFSGDKVLISERADGLLLRGWPDYPHLGIGTL